MLHFIVDTVCTGVCWQWLHDTHLYAHLISCNPRCIQYTPNSTLSMYREKYTQYMGSPKFPMRGYAMVRPCTGVERAMRSLSCEHE